MDIKNELLSLSEVSEILNVSKRTVLRWLEKGKLQGVRVGERLVRVPRDSLKSVLKKYSTCTSHGKRKKELNFDDDPFLIVDEWAPEAPEEVPTDLASEHDHYLYGAPRRRKQ